MKREKIWDFWAGRYENLWVQKHSLKPTRKLVINEITNLIEATLPAPVSLLDVGCGTGQLIEELALLFPRKELSLTGIDPSQKMIEKANEKNIPGVSFHTADAHNLPFSEHSFNIITCCHSFPYYQSQARSLNEMRRVMKLGGSLLLIQASENSIYDKLIMALVKFTTGKAIYPSQAAIKELINKSGLYIREQKRLATASYMPSIILSISAKGS